MTEEPIMNAAQPSDDELHNGESTSLMNTPEFRKFQSCDPNESGQITEFYGRPSDLDLLESSLKRGWTKTSQPSAHGLLGAIHTTIQALFPSRSIPWSVTCSWINHTEYREIVFQRTPEMSDSERQIEYFEPTSLSLSAAQLLLEFLPNITGFEKLSLGMASQSWLFDGYDVFVTRLNSDDSNDHITLWISQGGFGEESQWSGFENQSYQAHTNPQHAAARNTNLKRKRDDDDVSSSESKYKVAKYAHNTNEIQDAPPPNTDLPFEHMAGITSEELILFFPNHVMKWPAICARVCEDGFNAAQITSLINQNWSAHDSTGQKIDAVASTTVQKAVEQLNREFHGSSRWTTKERPKVTKGTYESTPWTISAAQPGDDGILRPAYTMKQIGAAYLNYNEQMSGEGSFRDKLAISVNLDDQITSEILTPLPQGFNPPTLPVDWKSAVQDDPSINIYDENSAISSHNPIPNFNRRPAHLHTSARGFTRQDLPPQVRDDAMGIIRTCPEMIAGEILLWLISDNGGRMTIMDIVAHVRNQIESFNSQLPKDSTQKQKPPVRCTYNKRKSAALEQRAKLQKKPFKEVMNEFNQFEAFGRWARRH